MIKLVCALSSGGVPVYVKSIGAIESEMLLGALIEASKSLSDLIGCGHVQKISFKEDTLLMTESEKGYTLVMLVDKAESYMERLLQVLTDELDRSNIPKADGSVVADHQDEVERVFNTFIGETVETTLPEVIEKVWNPIVETILADDHLSTVYHEAENLLNRPKQTNEWVQFASHIDTSRSQALEYAYKGAFDFACAASINLEGTASRLFAIKMGALALSMANTHAPPLEVLKELAADLPSSNALTDLARKLVGHLAGEIIPADYSRAFREAVKITKIGNTEDDLLKNFLFLDSRVVNYPDFVEKLVSSYEGQTQIITSYISAITERRRIFENLYSVTNFETFKTDLTVYKTRMKPLIKNINVITSQYEKVSPTKNDALITGITASFQIQNYIALLTALCESPILPLGDRIEILDEVVSLYEKSLLKLLNDGIPLFSFTLDSIFQSVSVALAEYFYILTGQKRKRHLNKVQKFFSEIYSLLDREWPKPHLSLSLMVIENALLPILTRAGLLQDEEIRLMSIAMKSLDVKTIDAIQFTKPVQYTTQLGNTVTALTALAARILTGKERKEVLSYCVHVALEVHTRFMSRGIICRDDIISTTYHTVLAADYLTDNDLETVADQAIALNLVAIQDIDKYDYEVPLLASPLIGILKIAYERLGDSRYRELAAKIFKACMAAWIKYGFETKAGNFKNKFADVATW